MNTVPATAPIAEFAMMAAAFATPDTSVMTAEEFAVLKTAAAAGHATLSSAAARV